MGPIMRAGWLLLLCLWAGWADAQTTYYVATNGANAAGRGGASNPWATISYALTQVPDHSVILVRPGTYNGEVRLRRNFSQGVTIRSELPYQARLRHTATVITTYDDVNGVEGITLEGFDIAHTPGSAADTVIQIQDSDGVDTRRITLRNNVLHDSVDNDIIKANNGASDLYFIGNIFYNQRNTDQHIDVNSVANVWIEDNIFFNSQSRNDTASFIVVKDSNGSGDGYTGASNVTIRRNIFLNWEGMSGDYFVLLGADGNSYYEATDVTIENNLMLGNSTNPMRAAFGCKGCRDVVFRANTIVGDLPANEYAFRLNREGGNPVNRDITFANNIWADPTGDMGDFADAIAADNALATIALRNNMYWNAGNAILNLAEDVTDVLGVSADLSARLVNPLLPSQAGIILPTLNTTTFRINGTGAGYASIREAFVALAQAYGKPGVGSPVIGQANPSLMPSDDLLGNQRDLAPDIGAFELLEELVFSNGFESSAP